MALTTLQRRKINSLSHRVSKDVIGKVLSHAYVIINREGLNIYVSSIDDESKSVHSDSDPLRINVHVSEGLVKKSWVG